MNQNVTIDRHKYIGGSDLPSILGLNAKYGTSIYDFARQKAGIIPNLFKGNEYTRYGQLMEPVIRDYINAEHGVNFIEDTGYNEEKHLRGNTDGIDRDNKIILEVKTFGEELDVDYYTPQCQFYMEIFNIDKCYLVGYKRPTDFYTGVSYDVENDERYFYLGFDPTKIVEKTILRNKAMWDRIENRIVKFQEVVQKLKENPEMKEEEFNNIFYGQELMTKANELAKFENTLSSLKEIEEQCKKLKDEIYQNFDENGIKIFETDQIKITKVEPTTVTKVEIDSKKLEKEKPEIYEEYKTTKVSNRKGYVLISKKGDKS